MEDVTALLQQLVAIDSINPDLVPGAAGEREIASFVADWLEKQGLEVEIDEPQPGRPSVIGMARGSGGGRSLMLNAHMDTVGVAGMERPHDPVVQGKRLYGRGAFDMKGGLAAIMLAAAEAKKRQLRGDVILTAVADEEYASIGTQSVVKRWHADAAIVTEPTELQLCVAHKGFIWLEITTQGVAAHGSKPDLGLDAIIKMGHVLVGLDKLNKTLLSASAHHMLGSGSLHASLIEGGQELSSYPASCTLQVERRTVPGETPEQVEKEIRSVLEQIRASDASFKASLKTSLVRQAFEVDENETIVQILKRQTQALLGKQPEIGGSTPWMDSAILSAAGIPTVVFGPGGAGAHAVVEWSDLEQVQSCANILLAAAEEFCA
ncbi:ArgE/DapE family deacylase [Ktedonosporobacter rubrisoli]|uniref:Probable succinyl-diaminopimelate desuccinylase n=1 Tax=Ktedonosporobacter rubrisoli TaxID=2509675 RepID=A0A4P6JRE9_KTERU|nr:ArgE/DapE family deacylase [Ktedonosporobacter rubrisoli]QBD77772.1 ArgE/DapE family deacylase [Ktedonosporobacter rubrisoli]